MTPQPLDTLCFVCQEAEPAYLAGTPEGEFKVCEQCLDLIISRARESLSRGDLSLNPLPTHIRISPLPSGEV